MDAISYVPVGVIRSRFTRLEGMPLQTVAAPEEHARIELRPELAPGLRALDGFSHLHLITHLHRGKPEGLEVMPFDDTPRGVFATRSPRHPNPIGLSVVRLLALVGASLEITGIDLLDGTPVLDIKPYVPGFDAVVAERTGWLQDAARRVHGVRADGRFESRAMSVLRPANAADLDHLIALAQSPDAAAMLSVSATEGLVGALEEDDDSGLFAIQHEGALAGAVRWVIVNRRSWIADVRTLMVDPAMRGRGLATAAIREISHHLIAERGLHRLEAEVFGFNVAGQHVFARAGFTREGMRRRAYDRGGAWQDSVIYGLLAEEL